jgi:ATP dependent DNA ligase-like protein
MIPDHMLPREIGIHMAPIYIRNKEWLSQLKLDGKRCRLQCSDGRVTGESKKNNPLAIPRAVRDAALAWHKHRKQDFVIDGELFSDSIAVFDVLQVGRDELWSASAEYRARYIRQMFKGCPSIVPVVSAETTTEKERLYDFAWNNGVEGIIFRRKSATYVGGKVERVLKVKFRKTLSVISTGQHEEKASVGIRLFSGRVMGSVKIPNGPLPKAGTVIEVECLYCGEGPEGRLVQPVFLGVRDDIAPDECTETQLQIKGEKRKCVAITNRLRS